MNTIARFIAGSVWLLFAFHLHERVVHMADIEMRGIEWAILLMFFTASGLIACSHNKD